MAKLRTETFSVSYSHTAESETFATYDEAVAAIAAVFTDPEIGHAGDISEGGNRTLVWADEASAKDDDGSRAVASIARVFEVDP